ELLCARGVVAVDAACAPLELEQPDEADDESDGADERGDERRPRRRVDAVDLVRLARELRLDGTKDRAVVRRLLQVDGERGAEAAARPGVVRGDALERRPRRAVLVLEHGR